MGRRLRFWIELLLAQLAIFAASWPLGLLLATLASLLLVVSGTVPPDPKGFGVAAVLAVATPVAVLLVFALLWFLVWRSRFRGRLPPGRFLLAWGLSLLLVPLAWAVWAIAVDYRLR